MDMESEKYGYGIRKNNNLEDISLGNALRAISITLTSVLNMETSFGRYFNWWSE